MTKKYLIFFGFCLFLYSCNTDSPIYEAETISDLKQTRQKIISEGSLDENQLKNLDSVTYSQLLTIVSTNLEKIDSNATSVFSKQEELFKIEDDVENFSIFLPDRTNQINQIRKLIENKHKDYEFEIIWTEKLNYLQSQIKTLIHDYENNEKIKVCPEYKEWIASPRVANFVNNQFVIIDSNVLVDNSNKKKIIYSVLCDWKFKIDCGNEYPEENMIGRGVNMITRNFLGESEFYYKFQDTAKWVITLQKGDLNVEVEPYEPYVPIKIEEAEFLGYGTCGF